eukprot:g21956.t1
MQLSRFWELQMKCCFTWKVCLGPWILGREEENKQVLHFQQLQGKVPLGYVGSDGRVDQGVLEKRVPAEGGQGRGGERRGGEYVSGGGISLQVAEMTSDVLLDANAGGMVGKDKGNPIADAGGKRGGESKSARDGSDPVEGPVDNGAGESLVEKEVGHFRGSLVEVGLIG